MAIHVEANLPQTSSEKGLFPTIFRIDPPTIAAVRNQIEYEGSSGEDLPDDENNEASFHAAVSAYNREDSSEA